MFLPALDHTFVDLAIGLHAVDLVTGDLTDLVLTAMGLLAVSLAVGIPVVDLVDLFAAI